MVRSDLIDGDAFEALARRLGLTYYETHAIDRANLSGVVLTHNSDGCIVPPGRPTRDYDFTWQDIPDGITHWFAQNVDVQDPRLTPIPIGLERVRWYPQLRKHDTIISTPRTERDGLLYLNVNTKIVSQREALYEWFGGQDWVTAERGHNGLDFPHYCRQLARHKFVLCPDGNGMDTHRAWEALYLGAYPVVSRHVFTDFFAGGLPFLVVDGWEHVTRELLERTAAEFDARAWVWDALTVGWWEKLIRSKL